MKSKIKLSYKPTLKVGFILLMFMGALLLNGCNKRDLFTAENFKLHTVVQISTLGELKPDLYEQIWTELDRIEALMSMTLSGSDIKRINDASGNHPVVVSPETFDVIEKAMSYSKLSNSFDITIGPVVSLWGIGTDEAAVPDQKSLDAALLLVGHEQIKLNADDYSVFLPVAGMKIDLGAIAKGYAADAVKKILLDNNIEQGIVNLGGNIITLGDKEPDKPWQIGLQHPDQSRGAYIGILPISDASIVTSGTYERFFEQDGKSYHHILSTKNGYPIENGLWSVSIISKASIDGDALSTLIFAEGLEKGLALIESLDDIEAVFITTDKKVYTSSGLKEIFTLTDDTFTLMP